MFERLHPLNTRYALVIVIVFDRKSFGGFVLESKKKIITVINRFSIQQGFERIFTVLARMINIKRRYVLISTLVMQTLIK